MCQVLLTISEQCKINDIAYIATEQSRIYGLVKNYSVSEGWVEIGVTEDEFIKINVNDIIDCEFYNESKIETEKHQTEKFLEMFAIKHKIPLDTFKKDAEKSHLAISYIYKIWHTLIDYEKRRLLSIFQIDKEGMEFIITKLNYQSLIINAQKEQIDKLSRLIEDLIHDLTVINTYNAKS